jgi:GNAT superfamily N-acetyltransferase
MTNATQLLNRADYITFDGPVVNSKQVAKDLINMGDWPLYYEEEVVMKAMQIQGLDISDIEKGRNLNIANLQAVRRQVTTQNGTVYMKTVYIKREEITDAKKSSRFLDQHRSEIRMAVGDKFVVNFKGSNSGNTYTTDKVKIDSISDDKVTFKFTENFNTNNTHNYVYSAGETITLPRTSSEDWNKDQSFKKFEAPTPQPVVAPTLPTAAKIVNSIDQISVGQEVMVKMRGVVELEKGEITYIHPRGNFIDIKVGDVSVRRKLGRFSTIGNANETSIPSGPQSEAGLSMETIRIANSNGLQINLGYVGVAPTHDTSRPTGVFEDYTESVTVDRNGNRSRRGTETRNVTRRREVFYEYTPEERSGMMSDEARIKLAQFNRSFGGFNFAQYAQETKQAIKASFPDITDDKIKMTVDIHEGGGMGLNVVANGKFTMTRNFNPEEKYVKHSYFTVDKDAQGGGLGKALFRALHKQYIAAGIKKIKVNANIDVGGYAWGRYGFTASASSAEGSVRSFENNVNSSSRSGRGGRADYTVTQADATEARRVFTEFYNQNSRSTRFPMNLLCCIGPQNKAGKAILMGPSWNGELDLTNPTQRLQMENYIGFTS